MQLRHFDQPLDGQPRFEIATLPGDTILSSQQVDQVGRAQFVHHQHPAHAWCIDAPPGLI